MSERRRPERSMGAGPSALILTTLIACVPPVHPSQAGSVSSRESPSQLLADLPTKEAAEGPEALEDTRSREEARSRGSVVDLPVEGFYPAVLHVPPGEKRRPLVVGAHGAYDRADAFCHVLAAAVRDRAFVLCPRGKKTDARIEHESASYFFPTHLWLEAEIAAAMQGLTRTYGDRIDTSRAVYAGFSQGAIMGALVVPRSPTRFPRALLVEGSYGLGRWNVEVGARFRRQGGERVAFVCGGWFCAEQARASAFAVDGGTARSKVVQARGGHTYGGDVARAIDATFPWLVDGDPRFAEP